MGPNICLIFREEKTEEQMGLSNLPKVPLLGNGRARVVGSPQGGEEFWGRRALSQEGSHSWSLSKGRDWGVGQTPSLGEWAGGRVLPPWSGKASSDSCVFSPRLALQHGDGHVVDYLSQPVIDYILKSQLYINTSG